ncbi:hypothetical protein BH10PSE10_BH10PSE10_23280 [soil metagenome]
MTIQRSFDATIVEKPAPETGAPGPLLAKIFIAALAVRWAYALSMYAVMGESGLKGLDSITYVGLARTFAEAISTGNVHGVGWLGDAPYMMPLFHWLTMLPMLLSATMGPLIYVLLQGAIDSGACIIVYFLGRSLDPRLALPSAIVAIFNPTQIVLSGLVYTDTPFTFFVALAILRLGRWVRTPSLRNAALAGAALGCAATIRMSIAPWAFFAIALLAVYALWRRVPLRRVATLVATLLVFAAGLGVIVTRNIGQYGEAALSPQGGDYLTLWVVPLAKEAQDRTPYTTTYDLMVKRTTDRYGPPSANPFEQSRRYQDIGREALRNEIHISSLVKSWLSGMFINLVSPAHLLSPPVSQLPRTGFYDTPGNSFPEKAFNYAFRSGNPIYTILLLIGTVGLAAVRLVQCIGLWTLVRERKLWPHLFFAATWIGFLLLLNGPIASPKYRLPLEPFFDVLTAAGLMAMYWRLRRDPRPA